MTKIYTVLDCLKKKKKEKKEKKKRNKNKKVLNIQSFNIQNGHGRGFGHCKQHCFYVFDALSVSGLYGTAPQNASAADTPPPPSCLMQKYVQNI